MTYAGASKWKKPFLSILRERRRRAWFTSAAKKLEEHHCDALIIPTSTYRYIKALLDTPLKHARVPVHFIFHGIGKGENVPVLETGGTCQSISEYLPRCHYLARRYAAQ